jgi:hypothetical protein
MWTSGCPERFHAGSDGTNMLPWMACSGLFGWSASSHELGNARRRREQRGCSSNHVRTWLAKKTKAGARGGSSAVTAQLMLSFRLPTAVLTNNVEQATPTKSRCTM